MASGDCLVQAINAGKLSGLQKVIDYYGIDLKDVAYFGDDCDDLSCITHSGYGVAVANADYLVREFARNICPCNDDDGVAKLLKKLMETK